MAKGTCVGTFHGTVTVREIVLGWLPSPGHCAQQSETTCLSVKEARLLVLELWPEEQSSVLTHISHIHLGAY